MKTLIILGLLFVGLVMGCSSEEDTRKTGEPTSQRWAQPWDTGGYDQWKDPTTPYHGGP